MSKDTPITTNKLEWAVNQAYALLFPLNYFVDVHSHGACEFCQMDLGILSSIQSQPSSSNRGTNERRNNRAYSESNDGLDTVYQGRLASMGIVPSKLEPFRVTDIANGVYADESDPLGRAWYHIPNLGAKFCDAVRKYSIVANYREAHVIARKKSKDSECMWIGIVGDPASYTTGSKRHLIDLMLRNPGQSFDNSSRRHHAKVRSNRTSVAGKRRKRRRRRFQFPPGDSRNESEGSHGTANQPGRIHKNRTGLNREKPGSGDDDEHDSVMDEDADSFSSQLSTTPSVLSMDQQVSNSYDFAVRETVGNASPPPHELTYFKRPAMNRFGLPHSASAGLSINTSYSHNDKGVWGFDSVYKDPVLYALREPPLPSPEAGRMFYLSRFDNGNIVTSNPQHQSYMLSANGMPRPRSPTISSTSYNTTNVRKYSVADLNELLISSDGHTPSV